MLLSELLTKASDFVTMSKRILRILRYESSTINETFWNKVIKVELKKKKLNNKFFFIFYYNFHNFIYVHQSEYSEIPFSAFSSFSTWKNS